MTFHSRRSKRRQPCLSLTAVVLDRNCFPPRALSIGKIGLTGPLAIELITRMAGVKAAMAALRGGQRAASSLFDTQNSRGTRKETAKRKGEYISEANWLLSHTMLRTRILLSFESYAVCFGRLSLLVSWQSLTVSRIKALDRLGEGRS